MRDGQTDTEQRNVFIVDDDADQRRLVTQLIESVGLRCSSYASGEELLADLEPQAAGCVLLDLRLRGMSGLAVQRGLADLGATLPVIMVTGYASVQIAVEAMKADAFDFLEKPVPNHELLEVVQSALLADARRRRELERIHSYRGRFGSLTEREREIAVRMIEGEASKVIALELGISEKTVEVHRSHVLKKMCAAATVDFVREAIEIEGLLESAARPPTSNSKQTAGWSCDGSTRGPSSSGRPSNGDRVPSRDGAGAAPEVTWALR